MGYHFLLQGIFPTQGLNLGLTHCRQTLYHLSYQGSRYTKITPYTKINSKWIKDLNVRPDTIKLLEENMGRTLDDINQSKILYDPPPRVIEIKMKVNKWDLIKLQSFCTARKSLNKLKRQPIEWEKIIAMKQLTKD